MARKRKQDMQGKQGVMPVMRADAAGIDIGATEIFVAVPPDRAAENVRSFPTFMQDLYALAEWLKQCGVKTVAMESTGVYWIPLFQILEERGFEVYRECPACEECAGTADRRIGLPVAAVLAFGRIIATFLSTGARGLRGAFFAAASGKLGADGGHAREPYAESTRPDEPTAASRHQ
jgi:hypothetical protein